MIASREMAAASDLERYEATLDGMTVEQMKAEAVRAIADHQASLRRVSAVFGRLKKAGVDVVGVMPAHLRRFAKTILEMVDGKLLPEVVERWAVARPGTYMAVKALPVDRQVVMLAEPDDTKVDEMLRRSDHSEPVRPTYSVSAAVAAAERAIDRSTNPDEVTRLLMKRLKERAKKRQPAGV